MPSETKGLHRCDSQRQRLMLTGTGAGMARDVGRLLQSRQNILRQRGWTAVLELDTGDMDLTGGQQFAAGLAPCLVAEPDRGTPDIEARVCQAGADGQQLIEPGRAPVLDRAVAHHQAKAPASQQLVVDTLRPQPVATGSFKELQVVGIVDNATCVGIFVIDTDVNRMELYHWAILTVLSAGRGKPGFPFRHWAPADRNDARWWR